MIVATLPNMVSAKHSVHVHNLHYIECYLLAPAFHAAIDVQSAIEGVSDGNVFNLPSQIHEADQMRAAEGCSSSIP